MLLPLILICITSRLGEDSYVESSISNYYYTSNGDVLVVILCIIGVFLFTHQGYDMKDKLWNSLAGLAAIGIAFFPTRSVFPREAFSIHVHTRPIVEIFGIELHFIMAIFFFVSIAYITLFLFTKGRISDSLTSPKKKRNILFYISGSFIVLSLVLLAIYFGWERTLEPFIGSFPIVFVLETIAVEAFALSFLTKGQTFFPDETHYLIKGFEDVKTTISNAIK